MIRIPLERALLVVAIAAAAYFAGRLGAAPSTQPLFAEGTANSNGRFVAVTGPYQTGVSILYVIDTESRNLAVYEARGGGRASGRITLVAARKIDLDMRLDGYHDESEYKYSELAEFFRQSGTNSPPRSESRPAGK